MPTLLTIRDEAMTPGSDDHVFELEVPSESLTVRELIRERVYQEVEDHNRRSRGAGPVPRYRGLVQPAEREESLNGPRPTRSKEVDWRRSYEVALEAYENHRFLVLVGDHQTRSLDETIETGPGTEVTFLRLMLLVGG